MTIRLLHLLSLRKVRLPLVILDLALYSAAIILYHDIRGKGFLMLGMALWCLLQLPYLHNNWMKYKKEEASFFWAMGVFLLTAPFLVNE